MLRFPMAWYGMESMVCYEILMLCYEISMLCYVMAYVVKDKHSATVMCLHYIIQNCLYTATVIDNFNINCSDRKVFGKLTSDIPKRLLFTKKTQKIT